MSPLAAAILSTLGLSTAAFIYLAMRATADPDQGAPRGYDPAPDGDQPGRGIRVNPGHPEGDL